MDEDAIAALATRFFNAIEAGDVETVKACYAPDVRIWHNTDGLEQGRDDNAAVLAAIRGRRRVRWAGGRLIRRADRQSA